MISGVASGIVFEVVNLRAETHAILNASVIDRVVIIN